jgi:hypothetical protein
MVIPGAILIAFALSLTLIAAISRSALSRQEFSLAAPQGFGDRQNSWVWAMFWWRGKLYVGTNRSFYCVEQWELHRSISPVLFPYPPQDPDVACTPAPADLPLQAEIWRWPPETNTWERVYYSPDDLDNPDFPGKKLARDIGFRSMAAHTDPGGVEALYVGGVTSQPMWDGNVPPPRLLRSTDGVSFVPVPQDPGTFMGSLPNCSLRSLTSFGGKLFVVNGIVQGAGDVLVSTNPAQGNNAWQKASPEGLRVLEMEVFNGWLYVGTLDAKLGYQVLKTQASGTPPYAFTTVVDHGGHLSTKPGDFVNSMHVFNSRLHVGTAALFSPPASAELVRITPDDSWELLVGMPRQTPAGWKYPLSGLPDGFANGFNDSMWRLQGSGGYLYVGTNDQSTAWRLLPGLLPSIQHQLGLDLYQTQDGWYFGSISTNGLDDPFNLGCRNFADTPHGLFLGTANAYYGLQLWRGAAALQPPPAPPGRLEVEISSQQKPILSWKPVASAVRYRLQRAPVNIVTMYPKLLGSPLLPGPYAEAAVTTSTFFVDLPLGPDSRFLYQVIAEDGVGKRSAPSNLVFVPLVSPPVNFGSLLASVDLMTQKGLFTSPAAASATRQAIVQAQAIASSGDLAGAVLQLLAVQRGILGGTVVLAPYASDLEIQVDKLIRRLTVAQSGLLGRNPLF